MSLIRTSEKCEKKNNSKLNTIVLPFFFHYFHNNIDVFIFSLPKWHKIQLKLRYTSKNLQNIINFVYKLAEHIKNLTVGFLYWKATRAFYVLSDL